MAAIKDLAKEYANYIKLNRDNPGVTSEIINRINGLTYTSSGSRLTGEDKKSLLDKIESLLSGKHQDDDGQYIVESEDSSDLINLITMIRKKA